jgi:hypothetical protein
MFKPDQYDPDPYEPRKLSLRDKATEFVRRIIMKIKEWGQ